MGIEQHVAGLRAERERLQAEVAKVQAVLQELNEQMERVDVALAALTGSGKAKRKKGSGVKTHEVVRELKRVLREGPLKEPELVERVAEQFRQAGQSLSGFKLRFDAALKDASFEMRDGVVALVGAVAPSSEGAA